MSEQETRMNAALSEMKAHLEAAQNRAINLAADLAVARAKIAELEKKCAPPSSP